MDELYTKLADLAARFGAEKLVLYGSAPEVTFTSAVISTLLYMVCRKSSAAVLRSRQTICPRC